MTSGDTHSSEIPTCDFLDVPIAALTCPEFVEQLGGFVRDYRGANPKTIFYQNAEGVYTASHSSKLARMLCEADIVHADGMSVVWASRFFDTPIPERLCTTDFIEPLAQMCAEQGFSLYLLGGTQQVVESAAAALEREFDGLDICGTHNGYFTDEQSDGIISEINRLAPSILLVGMGRPRQERWILEKKAALHVPVCIACGGLFKYIAGEELRAPVWMRNTGLEWLHRLVIDPRRMWKRYLVGNTVFMYHVCKARLTRKRSK